jgi:hypothetical protein
MFRACWPQRLHPAGMREPAINNRPCLSHMMQRETENSEDFKEATHSFVEKREPVF